VKSHASAIPKSFVFPNAQAPEMKWFYFATKPIIDCTRCGMETLMRIAIYSRVSTAQQSDEAQYGELLALCERSGWELVGSYREKISGVRSAEDRAQLKRLLCDARKRAFDKVVVWSADRLGRSMRHLVSVLGELNDLGIHVFSYRQGIDTETPMGAMLWQFLGIFAEFENTIRKERQALGIAKAKAAGVRFGRPAISREKQKQIIALRAHGMGINKIGRTLGVGCEAIYRTLGMNKYSLV
jgi:DNA invertase Pin-like site-specific DNA recombinase